MSGLDDLIGSLPVEGRWPDGGQAGLGLDDLLGGLLGGGGSGAASGGAGACRTSSADSSAAARAASGGGMNMGALVAILGPLVAKFPPERRPLEDHAGRPGERAQRPGGLVGRTGADEPLEPGQVRAVIGEDAVHEVAREAGISDDEAADVLAAVCPRW